MESTPQGMLSKQTKNKQTKNNNKKTNKTKINKQTKTKEPKTWVLLRLLHFILTRTAFNFNDKLYEQISGTTIGTKCAILSMDKLERDFIATRKLIPRVWWRYIDDIFIIWQHNVKYSFLDTFPVSILYKSIAVRYRPVRVADGPITARYRFIKNASWVKLFSRNDQVYGGHQ